MKDQLIKTWVVAAILFSCLLHANAQTGKDEFNTEIDWSRFNHIPPPEFLNLQNGLGLFSTTSLAGMKTQIGLNSRALTDNTNLIQLTDESSSRENSSLPPNATLTLGSNGDIGLQNYPNTRNDGAPNNFLGTTLDGTVQSYSMKAITHKSNCDKQGVYNIECFGAIANDGIDDRDSIQAALDFAESMGGGRVLIPVGVYNVVHNNYNEGLYIGSNTLLIGFGAESELRYTGHLSLPGSAIVNRMSSGKYTAEQQRLGNINIQLRNFKITHTELTDFKNIAISLSGVNGGSIENVWIDSCGGYSLHIGRTNDDANAGVESKNIRIDNLKITNFRDQGIEISGATSIKVTNVNISGQGVTSGFGQALLARNGSQDVLFSNITISKDPGGNNVCAIGIWGWGGLTTVNGARKTKHIIFENIHAIADIAIRMNPTINTDSSLYLVEDVVIRNSNFKGYDATVASADIRVARGLVIENVKFSDFERHLQFTNPGNTTLQNTVSDVTIRNNEFNGGGGIDFFGIKDMDIYNNRFYNISDAPITIRGGEYVTIKGNHFHNIGLSANQFSINLSQLNASSVKETTKIKISNNSATDDRETKYTHNLVHLFNSTDYITIKNNDTRFANNTALVYLNEGDGINIRLESDLYIPIEIEQTNLDPGMNITAAKIAVVGNIVTVSGRFTVDPSLTATLTSFELSLPPGYNSQISNAQELSGIAVCGSVAGSGSTGMVAEIFGSPSNNTAKFQWVASDVSGQTWSYSFSYMVLPF